MADKRIGIGVVVLALAGLWLWLKREPVKAAPPGIHVLSPTTIASSTGMPLTAPKAAQMILAGELANTGQVKDITTGGVIALPTEPKLLEIIAQEPDEWTAETVYVGARQVVGGAIWVWTGTKWEVEKPSAWEEKEQARTGYTEDERNRMVYEYQMAHPGVLGMEAYRILFGYG